MNTVPLGDIVDFYSGGTPSKAKPELWEGDVPWFSAKDMKRPRLTDSADHLSEEVFRSTRLRKLPAGTVAMVVRGMILAHTVPIAVLDVDAAINQDLKALLPRREIEPSFLAAMLRAQHASILAAVGTAAHGTKKLETRVLEEIRIPLPPLDHQRRVIRILDQVDVLRKRRRTALRHAESLVQSTFFEIFQGQRFDPVRADQLMPNMRNGLSPATNGEYECQVLTLTAVTQGPFDPTSVKSGKFAVVPPPDRRVASNDFLICRGNGNKALVGTGTFSREERSDLVFPDTVIAGRIDPSLVTLPFLETAWKQAAVRRQIEAVARTTNGTYKVNQKTLGGVTIPLPPLELQREFARNVEQINHQRAIMRKALRLDDELFASLQSRAFRGEL